jgi:spermidine/putrescine transport system ATP-binding protein
MSDRIAVMDGGRVQQLADPKTLYERPQTSFVADFIGTSNALELSVDRRDGELAIMEPGPGVRVVVAAPTAVGETVQISIRPEKISIVAGAVDGEAAATANGCRVSGVAVERVYLGSVSQTVVELPGGERLAVHELNDDEVSAIEPGDPVTLSWPARHSLVVAEEGGR